MAGPWDKYSSKQRKGPWDKYGADEPSNPYSLSTREVEPEEPGFLREVADTGLSVGKGALGLVQSVTNVFGADNAASQGLGTAREYLGSLESDQQQDQRKMHAQRMADAEATGSWWEEAKAAGKNFIEDPIDYAAEGAGSLLGFAPLRLIGTGAKVLGLSARKSAATGLGGAVGVGAVKGQQYEMVKAAKLEEGYSEAEAEEAAVRAQGYHRDNAVDLITGGVLGAVAGGTGAEAILLGAGKMAGKGLAKRVATGVLTETPFEAAQGGQERFAGNRALIREGYDVDPMQGVTGQAVTEGLMSAPVGGGMGALQGYTPTQDEIDDRLRREAEVEKARNDALVEAERQAAAQQAELAAKAERDQKRAYYAQQLPFEAFVKQRAPEIVNENITPEIIQGAYEEAFFEAVSQELPPPDRAKFEKDYKANAEKAVKKDVDALTQEYYATLDNIAATDVDLLGDPVELKPEGLAADPVPEPEQGLRNRRQMDFLGELDRTVQDDYSPVMPVSTPAEGTPATTVFTQTPVDDSGLPGALEEATSRATQGGVVVSPPNTPTPVAPNRTTRTPKIKQAVRTEVDQALKNELISEDQHAELINELEGSNKSAAAVANAVRTDLARAKANPGAPAPAPLSDAERVERGQINVTRPDGTRVWMTPLPTAASVPAQEKVGALAPTGLSSGQQAVYDTMLGAAQNNEFDQFQQSDGTLNYTAIAQASGLKGKQAAYAAVKQAVDKVAEQLGTTRDGMKAFLANRTKQVRTTEAADSDMLGTNPDNFTKGSLDVGAQLDNGDLFGNDAGATASFGTIESTGGSQSAVGENVQPTATELARPDPVAEKRKADAEAKRQAAINTALTTPEAAEAAADWNEQRSNLAPFAKDLSRQDAFEWMMSYWEWKNGDITEDQLAAEQRDIERRYDADPARAALGPDGTGGVDTQRALLERTATGDQSVEAQAKVDAKDAKNEGGVTQGLSVDDVPKSLKITLEKVVDGKTQRKQVDARKALLTARQRVEKLNQLRVCLG